MKVLCIGGPLDGQRKEVRDRRGVIVGSAIAEPGAMPVEFRYEIELLQGSRLGFFIAHPKGTDIDLTMAKLIERYRP